MRTLEVREARFASGQCPHCKMNFEIGDIIARDLDTNTKQHGFWFHKNCHASTRAIDAQHNQQTLQRRFEQALARRTQAEIEADERHFDRMFAIQERQQEERGFLSDPDYRRFVGR